MSDAAEDRKELQFPSSIRDAWDQKTEIERQMKSLEKRKKALEKFIKDQLAAELPTEPDESGHRVAIKDNVKLTAYNQKYPRYAKAVELITETLVPKTKRDEVSRIIDENSTEKEQMKLSFVEPDDEEESFGDY